MHGVYSDTALVLPADWLVWLATSSARLAVYRLQGWHGVFRVAHIAGTATFFGAIVLLDLRLLGWLGRDIALDALARIVLPVTHWSFGVTLASGVLLFLYDPIQVGSHTWFLPKLLLLGAALVNASIFSLPKQTGLKRIGGGALTRHAKLAGALSVLLWAGVIVTATANHEERPLVRGRSITRPSIASE